MSDQDKNEVLVRKGVAKLMNGKPLDLDIISSSVGVVTRQVCDSKYKLFEDIIGTAIIKSMSRNKVKMTQNRESPLKKPAGNWKNTMIFKSGEKTLDLVIPSEERVEGHPDKKGMIASVIGAEVSKFLRVRYFSDELLSRRTKKNFDNVYQLAQLDVLKAIDETFELIGEIKKTK